MSLTENQKVWLKGLVAAVVGGVITSFMELSGSGFVVGDWKHLFQVAMGGAVGGVLLYLKKSPDTVKKENEGVIQEKPVGNDKLEG